MAGRFGNTAQDLNADNVSILEFGTLEGASLGTYHQAGISRWHECTPDGRVSFVFEERSRDEFSIYLHDASRAVDLQLDLHRNVVVYTDTRQSFDLYSILSATSRATGLTLQSTAFGAMDGRPLGTLRRSGDKTWIECDQKGESRFIFNEIQRDDWSVYLHDQSRAVNLQIDLHRGVIQYHDNNTDMTLYEIKNPRTAGVKEITPAANGRTVNRIDFPTGTLVQTESGIWVERDKAGTDRFHYIETARNTDAIHLQDVSRHVKLQLHVKHRYIIYSDRQTAPYELYPVNRVYSKVNGHTANRVVFANFEAVPLGEYRQTGHRTWSEYNADSVVTFRFLETHRDNWSVYLHDASRDVSLQLDLHTRKVLYTDNDGSFTLYTIEGASSNPDDVSPKTNLPVKGQNVRTVRYGELNGRPLGSFRQVGATNWQEISADGSVKFQFTELRRTHDGVHLEDSSRGVTLILDLATRRIHYRDSNQSFALYTVLDASTLMQGWLASEISFGHDKGDTLGVYRRLDEGIWGEFDKSGNILFRFEELELNDWSIRLRDPGRDVSIELDLRLQRIMYGKGFDTSIALYRILSESIESGRWLHSEQIRSRSVLTHDLAPDGSQLNERPVYRTSVSFSAASRLVDIWASKEVTVEIEGREYTIDPVQSAQVRIPLLSKISVSVPATDLDCPKLMLRTDLMMPEDRHPLYPDVEAHRKLVDLPEGGLAKARNTLGLSSKFSDEDLAHVQKAMQNIASTKQYTYNQRSHGVHHDRVLHPANMQHPHFTIDFSSDSPRYQPLRPEEVAGHVAGARLVQLDSAQDFLGIGHFFSSAAKVVVHTVVAVAEDVVKTAEEVVTDVVQTAENVGHDIVQTVEQVGEDLIHGDILDAGKDLWQGGEHLGSDLTKGAVGVLSDVASGVTNVTGDVVSGAGQLVVITLHAAEEAVQFVLTHTGVVGELIQSLLDKVGAAVEKVVGWLLDALGWDDILQTHDILFDLFNDRMDEFAKRPAQLKERADKFFGTLADTVSQDLDKAIDYFEPARAASSKPNPSEGHSAAVEKIEWFLGKLMHNSESATALASPFKSTAHQNAHESAMDDILGLIDKELGRDGDKIIGAIEHAVGDISAIFTDPQHTPEYLIVALLEVVKATAVLAIDAISIIVDAVLDLLQAILEGLKSALNAVWHLPFIGELYKTVTQGREMSVLGMTCLLLAIPMTIVSKAMFDTTPFPKAQVAADLAELEHTDRGLAILYSFCHITLGPISVMQDGIAAVEGALGGIDKLVPVKVESNISPGASNLLLFVDTTLNTLALITSTPAPIDEPYVIPWAHAKEDVFERPSYFGHVTYWYIFAGYGLNIFLTVGDKFTSDLSKANKYLGNGTAVFNFANGLALMGLMATIDVADRGKSKALKLIDTSDKKGIELFNELENDAGSSHVPYWTYTGTNGEAIIAKDKSLKNVADWEKSMRNYREWGLSTGGIPRKGFSNVMDSFPLIGQIAAMPSLVEPSFGLSLIGTALFDLLGHWGEGITYAERTGKSELV